MAELIVMMALGAAWALWRVIRRLLAAASSVLRPRETPPWLPVDLCDAELLWSEKAFRCQHPVRIDVRIDRAYRLPDGVIELVEFKRRAVVRVHRADIVELSVQRYVLQRCGHAVSLRAHVVIVEPEGFRMSVLPVTLEPAREVERRVARLLAVRAGKLAPAFAVSSTACVACGHRRVCGRSPHR